MKKYEKQFIPDYFFILDNICKIKNKTSQYTENNKLKSKGFDNCFTVYFALIKIINDLLPIYPNAILEKDPNDNNIFGVYLSTSNIEIQKTCKNRISISSIKDSIKSLSQITLLIPMEKSDKENHVLSERNNIKNDHCKRKKRNIFIRFGKIQNYNTNIKQNFKTYDLSINSFFGKFLNILKLRKLKERYINHKKYHKFYGFNYATCWILFFYLLLKYIRKQQNNIHTFKLIINFHKMRDDLSIYYKNLLCFNTIYNSLMQLKDSKVNLCILKKISFWDKNYINEEDKNIIEIKFYQNYDIDKNINCLNSLKTLPNDILRIYKIYFYIKFDENIFDLCKRTE